MHPIVGIGFISVFSYVDREEKQVTPFCDRCGKQVSADALFCTNCGRELQAVTPPPYPPSRPVSYAQPQISEPQPHVLASRPRGVSILTALLALGGVIDIIAAVLFLIFAAVSLSWLGLLAGLGAGGDPFLATLDRTLHLCGHFLHSCVRDLEWSRLGMDLDVRFLYSRTRRINHRNKSRNRDNRYRNLRCHHLLLDQSPRESILWQSRRSC